MGTDARFPSRSPPLLGQSTGLAVNHTRDSEPSQPLTFEVLEPSACDPALVPLGKSRTLNVSCQVSCGPLQPLIPARAKLTAMTENLSGGNLPPCGVAVPVPAPQPDRPRDIDASTFRGERRRKSARSVSRRIDLRVPGRGGIQSPERALPPAD